MESNRDEAIRCLNLAEKFLTEGRLEKAEKFVQKSLRLFPTDRAKNLFEQMQSANSSSSSRSQDHQNQSDGVDDGEGDVRRRKNASSANAGGDETTDSPQEGREYTSEQVAAVKR